MGSTRGVDEVSEHKEDANLSALPGVLVLNLLRTPSHGIPPPSQWTWCMPQRCLAAIPPGVWSLMYCNKHHVMRGQKERERACGFFWEKAKQTADTSGSCAAGSQKISSFYYVQQVEAFAQEIDIWTHDTAWRHMHKSTRNILLCKCL